MKNYILVMTLFLAAHLYGQEIPLPKSCLPLNGTNSEDIMSDKAVDIYGKVYSLADRFGAKGKAIAFDQANSYITVPMPATDGQVRREATLTYWMHVTKDSITQAFWATGGDGELLLGMKKKGMRAVLDIYHKDSRQNTLPDQQWMWSDSNFTEGDGWYFVAIAYSDEGTHFYLGTPVGKMTECYSAFTPDWSLVAEICVGTVGNIPAAGMDDFKVYDVALSKEQVSALYHSESQLCVGNESLLNVETGIPLYSSAWYFHCVGLKETFRYVMQNQADLSFLGADAGYALAMTPKVESNYQQWAFYPVSDTAKGRIFTISNAATGMNLTDTRENVLQQVSDNTDAQKWCMGQVGANNQTRGNIKESNKMIPLYEEIYFDKSAQVIRVHINFPEAENVKIRLTDLKGALLREMSLGNVMLLDKNIQIQTTGIYLVTVESDSYKINRKIIANF